LGEDADFWIVVNSKTGDLIKWKQRGVEQTYAISWSNFVKMELVYNYKVALGHCLVVDRGGLFQTNILSHNDATDLANCW